MNATDTIDWESLMPHERAALARAFGQGDDAGDDATPAERAVILALRD